MNKYQQKAKDAAKWLLFTAFKFGLVLLIAGLLYLIYLDSKVSRKFEGQKWQVPAHIYARPLLLFPNKPLSKSAFIEELKLLNYQPVKKLKRAGQYTVTRHHVSFVRRAFQFADGYDTEHWYTVEFDGDKVKRIKSRDESEKSNFVRLEPLLLERLQSPHKEDRELIALEDIPEDIKDTLLLIEDNDFYHHSGVSPLSIIRALWVNLNAGKKVQGGSTLTQQLAKNLFLTHEKSYIRKLNEAFIALILDYRFSKDQLLNAYFNEIYMGQFHSRGIHGFGLASRYYFDKPLNELVPHEYALLVAIIKGPSFFDPRRQLDRAIERRDLVLRKMLEANLLSVRDYKLVIDMPLGVVAKERYMTTSHPAFIDKVKRELRTIPALGTEMHSGISVFTSLDPLLQKKMEATVEQGLTNLEKQYKLSELQTAMVSVDIASATISAMVGDRNTQYAGFNRVLDSRRNIGSLVKPALYLTALEQPSKYFLGTVLEDKEITITHSDGDVWSPLNASKKYLGKVSLQDGLVNSYNVPTVWLGRELAVHNIQNTIKRLGVDRKLPNYPSMMLGAISLTPIEVAQMYHTIANNGALAPLSTVTAVINNFGDSIWEKPIHYKPTVEREAAYILNHALNKVTVEGTAKQLSATFGEINFIGKTGTTNQKRDSWFAGADQNLLTITWIGNDDNKVANLSGARGALTQFINLYKKRNNESYTVPKPVNVEVIVTGKIEGDGKVNCDKQVIMPIYDKSADLVEICD